MDKVEQGKGQLLLSQGVRDYDQAGMVADFVRQARMNPDLSRSVWHTAISFDPTDEARLRANPQLMRQVATDYLRGMGLDQSQYVVIRHSDTGHAHFHIIANRVANDGKTVSDSHNFSRSEKLLRQIEKTYQLTPLNEQAQRASVEHLPDRDRSRIQMRDQVRASLSRSASGAELQEDLARHHIKMLVNRDQTGQPRGISFEQTEVDPKGAEIRIAFKGSKLHQALSLSQIQQQLGQNAQLRQKQPTEAATEQERTQAVKVAKAPPIEDKHSKHGLGRGR